MILYQSTYLNYKAFILLIFSLKILSETLLQLEEAKSKIQTNVLFITFDDLRTDLSIYGFPHIITPNFERLAKKSVVFDNAYCQVSVCNPSRDSMLTGLRPDTTGSYSFQFSYYSHITIPSRFIRGGYSTAGRGKIYHWEPDQDENLWNKGNWHGDWYNYQNLESYETNSTVLPDRYLPEDQFRDHNFTTSTISLLKELHQKQEYFFIGHGFKLPHLELHIPYRYFDMYRSKQDLWNLTDAERTYPPSSPTMAYRCCAKVTFDYMNKEGSLPFTQQEVLADPDVDRVITQRMHTELMWGYSAAITYLDFQLGRILDTIDELDLWKNLTIVLTADHGLHNGEKGLWEKWTLFDESTHVPLIIYHPDTPYPGKHYRLPVELIDIFPTLLDLSKVPAPDSRTCTEVFVCKPLQGQSLSSVILGPEIQRIGLHNGNHTMKRNQSEKTMTTYNYTTTIYSSNNDKNNKNNKKIVQIKRRQKRKITYMNDKKVHLALPMPRLMKDFAISQLWRCAPKYTSNSNSYGSSSLDYTNILRSLQWTECDHNNNQNDTYTATEYSVMGYSVRTLNFRYTAWIHMNRTSMEPLWDVPLFAEELYDYRREEQEQQDDVTEEADHHSSDSSGSNSATTTASSSTATNTIIPKATTLPTTPTTIKSKSGSGGLYSSMYPLVPNVAQWRSHQYIRNLLKWKLLNYLKSNVVYRGPY